jgi:NADH-quinone oxidoreductase subunit N
MRIYYSVFIQLLKNDKIFKNLILILAISSIIIGAIGACDQTKIKRFLGYTTINQMGFILLGLAVQNFYGFVASYIYLVIYVILNLILFSILLGARYKDRELIYITDLSIFFRNNKHAGLLFILLIFSLAGLPPTIGFFMKFLIIKSLVVSGYLKLAIFILYINVISIFYYVRLVKIIFLNSEDSTELVKTHLNNSSKNSIENV